MRIIFFILFVTLSLPAYAESKKESLKEIEAKVSAEKEKQADLDKKMKTLEKDMKGLKTDLIKTTGQVQKNEKELGTLEKKMVRLTDRKNEITDKLDQDKQSLADLIVALERIRRLPPQALIARPGAPLETAQAAVVLGAIMPDLNKRADEYRKNLEELQSIENDLASNKNKLEKSSEKLKSSQGKMEALVSERQDALKVTKNEFVEQEREVAALSRKAGDLKDLISKLEAQDAARKRAAKESRKKKSSTKSTSTYNEEMEPRKKKVDDSKLGISLASLGPSQLPVPGNVSIKYGQRDDIGAPSEGLHINARSGATVVAPMEGVVRYAGPFKSYGSIILIEHKNNYHSLIAGLGRIDTVVGQRLEAGEPVGSLSPKASLYYELRYNGQPINPARKFAGLG